MAYQFRHLEPLTFPYEQSKNINIEQRVQSIIFQPVKNSSIVNVNVF